MVNSARGGGGSKKTRTGITISPTELCATDIRLRNGPDRVWRAPLDPPPTENGPWPSLISALADLARTLGITEGSMSVSLVAPLAEVRRIELPPVRDDDVQRLLLRGASRYFVGARAPQIVGASLAGRRVRGAPTVVIAAAAPARLIAAIRHAAQHSGWTIDGIAPAEGAWAAAALALWPTFAKQNAHVLAAHDDRTDLLRIDEGQLVSVRRFRAGAADAPMIADAVGVGARVGIFGAAAPRRELNTALNALGVTVAVASGDWATSADRADVLAAHFAANALGPALRGEDVMSMDRARARKASWQVAGAAAALLVAAAAVELWGVHHQLQLVRDERARIRPEIASTMIGRTTVDAAYRHLTILGTIERASPQWSSVIGTLSDALPDDAHLIAIRTRDDSVIVDGVADHAARVFDALEKANGLIAVRAAAPVRRELQDGGTEALEHFTIAARVASPGTVTGSIPASNAGGRRPGQ